ncbi:MAG TPA: asparagine synthase (glutamine-hydrolyzing), partial [Bryobacteraceae bacterium]|nr:asparagine synthase (glutamine-hydrolyzing) [Bryobacteraceae bacterium]
MSGICGLWRRDGAPAQPDQIERMSASLAHRGPNGGRCWHSGAAALAHRMLHAAPESAGEQLPFEDCAAGLAITADARLDNREELIEALGIDGGRELPDSQLLLAAYARWGAAAPEHLLGDFAFAIWDSNREQLFCARDHFGVKPLYYCETGELVAFASEIKALLALDAAPRRLNEHSVAAFLCDDFRETTETFYCGILRLAPGHRLIAGRGSVRVERYWELDPTREISYRSDEQYEEHFRALFAEAVRTRCRTARPLGSELSGGLDSSAITCVARDLLAAEGRGPLATFSLCFPETEECDEGPFIRAMVTRGGIDPRYVSADELSPFDDWERIAWHLDEPWSVSSLYLHWGLYGAACRAGVGVLLDGLDGDATVSHGDGYLLELARSGRWYRWLREARGLRRVRGTGYRSLLRRGAVPALLPRSRTRQTEARTVPEILARPLAETWQQARKQQVSSAPAGISIDRLRHYQHLTSGALTHSLEVADKAAAAFALEVRHPFLDKRLVEFCLALPGGQKLSRGWDRSILRRALHTTLPGEIRWRPDKTDLRPHFQKRLVNTNSQVLERAAQAAALLGTSYIDLDAVNNVRRTYASTRRRAD